MSSSEEEEDEEELGLRRDDADHERFAALYCEMLDFTHCYTALAANCARSRPR